MQARCRRCWWVCPGVTLPTFSTLHTQTRLTPTRQHLQHAPCPWGRMGVLFVMHAFWQGRAWEHGKGAAWTPECLAP